MKRSVFVFVLFAVLCTARPAAAEQSPPNEFAGQILSGRDGRVGIGTMLPAATLDIYQGEIKIGSTGAACDKELAGALRSANEKLEFCDGTSWRKVSLDKAQ